MTMTNAELERWVDVVRTDLKEHLDKDEKAFSEIRQEVRSLTNLRYWLMGAVAAIGLFLGAFSWAAPYIVRSAVQDVISHKHP